MRVFAGNAFFVACVTGTVRVAHPCFLQDSTLGWATKVQQAVWAEAVLCNNRARAVVAAAAAAEKMVMRI